MKRLMPANLAGLLLMTLAACSRDSAPEAPATPETPESQPAQEEPDTPPEPLPEEPAEPDTPEPEPESPPESGTAEVTDHITEGTVEDIIGYTIRVPQVSTGDAAVDQILNDYYTSAAGKVEDLCWGDLYVTAMEAQQLLHVAADFTVERSDGEILSICRTVTVENLSQAAVETTRYAETFRLLDGGLMSAGDFFTVEETVWRQRLADGVRRIISEDPYHAQRYDADWETLCESELDRDAFYVTDDAFVVLYQPGALGPSAQTAYPIPWDSLADITA